MARPELNTPVRILHNPTPAQIPADFLAFLAWLEGPVLIRIDGHEGNRSRAICTLLHGNEPSGARAMHRWLLRGERPAVNILCLIAAVRTALHEQPLRHRFMPGQRDQNRCFRPPFDDEPGRIALEFLGVLQHEQPECLLDLHNTSGRSPAFGVACRQDSRHLAIVSLFSSHLVLSDLRLGAIMELSSDSCPMVTIECGGANDPDSDRVAAQGLQRFLSEADILHAPLPCAHMDIYRHPVRLELAPQTRIAWNSTALETMDLTIPPDLELLNFRGADTNTTLGWLGPRGLAPLIVRNGRGEDVMARYFRASNGRLHPAQALKLFMITTNEVIASSDCLLYAAAQDEHETLDA